MVSTIAHDCRRDRRFGHREGWHNGVSLYNLQKPAIKHMLNADTNAMPSSHPRLPQGLPKEMHQVGLLELCRQHCIAAGMSGEVFDSSFKDALYDEVDNIRSTTNRSDASTKDLLQALLGRMRAQVFVSCTKHVLLDVNMQCYVWEIAHPNKIERSK